MGRRSRRVEEQQRENIPLRIAIIGAGLSGLSAAICLERHPLEHVVTLYERDATLSSRREGYGLTLTYHPSGILQSPLGILDELAALDCPSRSHFLFLGGRSGRIGGYFGNDFHARRGGWGQRGNLRVPRQTVRQVLVNKLQHTPIRWGHRLVEMGMVSDNDATSTSNTSQDKGAVRLRFENGETVEADVVIAADGIRSTVVQLWIPDAPRPRSLGVRIILGITQQDADSTNSHYPELLQERGFYTLDTGMRLFVMPYSGSATGLSLCPNEPVRFMWQLSFAIAEDHDDDDDDNQAAYTFQPQQLQEEALHRTQGWHEPVQSLILSTPLTDIWGTLLRDRDPLVLQQHLLKRPPRVIVTGDALHAMSPFKGQGANRCLQDGAIIAKWLSSSSTRLSAAVKGAVREMTQRTASTVAASRAAAQFWHSPPAMQRSHKFAGINGDGQVDKLLQELENRGINAETNNLHQRIRCVIEELGLQEGYRGEINCTDALPDILVNGNTSSLASKAVQAASRGALGTLRQLSWEHPDWLRRVVVIMDKTTCLHVAAAAGQVETVHWLITQAGCNLTALNALDQTARDAAAGHPDVCKLLDRIQEASTKSKNTQCDMILEMTCLSTSSRE